MTTEKANKIEKTFRHNVTAEIYNKPTNQPMADAQFVSDKPKTFNCDLHLGCAQHIFSLRFTIMQNLILSLQLFLIYCGHTICDNYMAVHLDVNLDCGLLNLCMTYHLILLYLSVKIDYLISFHILGMAVVLTSSSYPVQTIISIQKVPQQLFICCWTNSCILFP